MVYQTRTYELESKDGELTISLTNGMNIQIPSNSRIAAYYAINLRGSKSCVLCFQNHKNA
ncbi:hypothetical protein HYU21_00280 [Candidatus Woesearchaeota archaeon]|nr:hypothetical protein [Candidatus Woesearchaeota archaeon]